MPCRNVLSFPVFRDALERKVSSRASLHFLGSIPSGDAVLDVIHLDEPIDSADPAVWRVYADWLADYNDEVGEVRARRIAMSLDNGVPAMYLEYLCMGESWQPSGLNYPGCCSPDFKMYEYRPYRWVPFSGNRVALEGGWWFEDNELAHAINPLTPIWNVIVTSRPDVARSFFDRIVELPDLHPEALEV